MSDKTETKLIRFELDDNTSTSLCVISIALGLMILMGYGCRQSEQAAVKVKTEAIKAGLEQKQIHTTGTTRAIWSKPESEVLDQ